MIQHFLFYFEKVSQFLDQEEIKFQFLQAWNKISLLSEIQASSFIQGKHILQEHHLHAKSYQNVEL